MRCRDRRHLGYRVQHGQRHRPRLDSVEPKRMDYGSFSRAGLSFNDFLVHMAPIVLVVVVVFVAMLPRLFRGSFDVDLSTATSTSPI